MPAALTDDQRATLRAVCDTVVPRIEREPDPTGHWARKASDIGVDQVVETTLDTLPEENRAGLLQLLDGLAQQGFRDHTQRSREQLLRNIALLGPDVAAGVAALQSMTLFFHYGLPVDPQTGQNPAWQTFGYPGPLSPPPQTIKPIRPVVPEGPELELEADVVVVGSGAGGGVIAGTLAQQGLKVCVLEAGRYLDESDFLQLEIPAYQLSFWRGGPTPTADLNVSLQAGSALGGGTVINWTNCLRTKPWVREQWAREHGLEGVDGPEFDRHLDAVLERINANDRCSDLNPPHERMRDGAAKLGWSFRTVVRNADEERYDPDTAGYMGFGDQSGSKLSTAKTFLQDAFDAGADILVGTWVDRVLVEDGRAAGVEATWSDPETGRGAHVTVRAPRVVVAAGALESPALLLRSGIGGPATGDYLRLHPCLALFGVYEQDMRAWWGPPHPALVDEFANVEDGYGFLIEGVQYTTAVTGSAIPFTSAIEHKTVMEQVRNGTSFIALVRDHGHGRVTVDADGSAVPWYAVTDERDARNLRRGLDAVARLHEAAGAREIRALAPGLPQWRRGDDLDAFVARVQRIPLRAGGHRLFSAHQTGSCRMGTDPATSVANPWGELHDVAGVWIGDGSAFPTPVGTNPMVSIMALAHRTAEAIAGSTETTTAAPLQAAHQS